MEATRTDRERTLELKIIAFYTNIRERGDAQLDKEFINHFNVLGSQVTLMPQIYNTEVPAITLGT